MTIGIPDGYRRERGLLWPAEDRECAKVVFDMTSDLEVVYGHCAGFRAVVQAGGNCGVWPAALAKRFGRVYTFEPDPMNFRCLCANAPGENVYKFNACLGNERKLVDLARDPRNIGAHYVTDEAQRIPVMRIDDLCLGDCDLIYLDVEGYEFDALEGALDTITRCRPVIAYEDKGLSRRYGREQGAIEAWLCHPHNGYRVAARPHRDVVLVAA